MAQCHTSTKVQGRKHIIILYFLGAPPEIKQNLKGTVGSQKYIRPHWVGAGLREDWISDLTLAVVIPFGVRGGKGRCE